MPFGTRFLAKTVVPHAKKTTVQVETMTYKNRHKVNQTITVEKKEKSPSFASLIISANTHLAHLQVAQANAQSKPAKEPNFAFVLPIKCTPLCKLAPLTDINSITL